MYFTPEKLAELNRGHGEVHEKFADLRERYFIRNYGNDRAKEHVLHGFARRLGTLVRCIDRVFEILPPDREDIPSRNCAPVRGCRVTWRKATQIGIEFA